MFKDYLLKKNCITNLITRRNCIKSKEYVINERILGKINCNEIVKRVCVLCI